jgi:hypothetical protein
MRKTVPDMALPFSAFGRKAGSGEEIILRAGGFLSGVVKPGRRQGFC